VDPGVERNIRLAVLTDTERCCGLCGGEKKVFAHVEHELIRFVPAKIVVDVERRENWMESYCNTANAGIGLDWFAFFYQLSNKTADRWSAGNFWNVFQTECPTGVCNVTWTSLQTASNTFWGPTHPKAGYLITAADQNGINH